MQNYFFFNVFKSSPKDIFFIAFRQRGERKGERETLVGERSIDWLTPVHSQNRDHTRPSQ